MKLTIYALKKQLHVSRHFNSQPSALCTLTNHSCHCSDCRLVFRLQSEYERLVEELKQKSIFLDDRMGLY